MRSPFGYNWDSPWLDCRRKWAYENLPYEIVPAPGSTPRRTGWGFVPTGGARPFAIGSAVHAGLEAWYFPTEDSPFTRLTQGIHAARESWRKDADEFENLREFEEEDLLMVESLLTGYTERYPTETWSVVGKPEHEFSVPLDGGPCVCTHPAHAEICEVLVWSADESELQQCTCAEYVPAPYTGKIDLLIEWQGKVLVVEHKTSGFDPTSFLKTYHLSDQMTGYIWASKKHVKEKYGLEVAGALLNGLGKGRIAKTKGTASHWYQRETFLRTSQDLARWQNMRCRIRNERARIVAEWHMIGRPGPAEDSIFYMQTESCFNWNRKCAYLEACLYHGEQSVIDTFYRRRDENSPEGGGEN